MLARSCPTVEPELGNLNELLSLRAGELMLLHDVDAAPRLHQSTGHSRQRIEPHLPELGLKPRCFGKKAPEFLEAFSCHAPVGKCVELPPRAFGNTLVGVAGIFAVTPGDPTSTV